MRLVHNWFTYFFLFNRYYRVNDRQLGRTVLHWERRGANEGTGTGASGQGLGMYQCQLIDVINESS